MKRILLFAVMLPAFAANAQVARLPVSSFYPSLNTYSSRFSDVFSFRMNSAALGSIKQLSAGIFSERRFMQQELASYSFMAALPTASGNFGLKGEYFGSLLYNETTIGLGYGRKLGSKLDVGVGFNYFTMRIPGYGSASALTFDAGLIVHLTEEFHTGMSIYNPVGMTIGKSSTEKLPSIYSIGLGYDASPQLFLGSEIVKTENEPLSINAGVQYTIAEKLLARGGISSANSVYYLGFGLRVNHFRLDVTASFHPYLGATPGLLFIYAPQP